MRKLLNVMVGINWLVVVANGIFFFLWFLWPKMGDLSLKTWEQNWKLQFIITLVALAVVGLNLLWITQKITRRKYATYIPFVNPKGQVAISVGALEDTLRKAGLTVEEVRDVKVHVMAQQRPEAPIKVVSILALEEGHNVPQVTARVQDVLSKRFREVVTQEGEVHYEIRVAKFRGTKGEPEEEEEEEFFRGPQYPVEE